MMLLILYVLWTYGYEKFAEIDYITDVVGHIMHIFLQTAKWIAPL